MLLMTWRLVFLTFLLSSGVTGGAEGGACWFDFCLVWTVFGLRCSLLISHFQGVDGDLDGIWLTQDTGLPCFEMELGLPVGGVGARA